MSSSSISITRQHPGIAARLGDYLELSKPRISALVLATVVASGLIATWGQPDPWALVKVVLGTALVAASASALNQWLEQSRDARMERTRLRPLPDGRLSGREVLAWAGVTLALGLAVLLISFSWPTTLAAGLTWLLYVWVYTPLKTRTSLNTAVGAVAGALPVWIGWLAVGGAWDVRALALYAIVFLWQFPHFMAIAWIYRQDYARAGMRMASVVDASGAAGGRQAVLAALTLLPVSFIPGLTTSAPLYLLAALVLGAGQAACALAFFARRDDRSARRLLRASILYLPLLLGMMVLIPLL